MNLKIALIALVAVIAIAEAAPQQCTTTADCNTCEHGLTAVCQQDHCHCHHTQGTQCTVDADCNGHCHHDNPHHQPQCHHGHCGC